MAHVVYSNGVKLEWDENISVGTLIRTYYSGYWILERIELREPNPIPLNADMRWYPQPIKWTHEEMKECPIFYFVQVMNDKGEPTKKNRKSCAASYCRRVDDDFNEAQKKAELKAAQYKFKQIQKFL